MLECFAHCKVEQKTRCSVQSPYYKLLALLCSYSSICSEPSWDNLQHKQMALNREVAWYTAEHRGGRRTEWQNCQLESMYHRSLYVRWNIMSQMHHIWAHNTVPQCCCNTFYGCSRNWNTISVHVRFIIWMLMSLQWLKMRTRSLNNSWAIQAQADIETSLRSIVNKEPSTFETEHHSLQIGRVQPAMAVQLYQGGRQIRQTFRMRADDILFPSGTSLLAFAVWIACTQNSSLKVERTVILAPVTWYFAHAWKALWQHSRNLPQQVFRLGHFLTCSSLAILLHCFIRFFCHIIYNCRGWQEDYSDCLGCMTWIRMYDS